MFYECICRQRAGVGERCAAPSGCFPGHPRADFALTKTPSSARGQVDHQLHVVWRQGLKAVVAGWVFQADLEEPSLRKAVRHLEALMRINSMPNSY